MPKKSFLGATSDGDVIGSKPSPLVGLGAAISTFDSIILRWICYLSSSVNVINITLWLYRPPNGTAQQMYKLVYDLDLYFSSSSQTANELNSCGIQWWRTSRAWAMLSLNLWLIRNTLFEIRPPSKWVGPGAYVSFQILLSPLQMSWAVPKLGSRTDR